MGDVYNNFMDRLSLARGFEYPGAWDALKGIHRPVDFARKFESDIRCKKYSSLEELPKDFIGFLDAGKSKIIINGVSELVDYMYLEKGVIRYIQCHEGSEKMYTKKFNFYDGPFELKFGYSSNLNGKLSYLHRGSEFILDDFKFSFSRYSHESSNIVCSFWRGLPFLTMELNSKVADSLTEAVFDSMKNIHRHFRKLNVKLFGNNDWLGKEFGFAQGLELLYEECSKKK